MTGLYPLSGVLRCGNPACGRRGTMAGYPRTGGKRAYICAPANGGCGQSVLAEPVEEIVRDWVVDDLADVERAGAGAGRRRHPRRAAGQAARPAR